MLEDVCESIFDFSAPECDRLAAFARIADPDLIHATVVRLMAAYDLSLSRVIESFLLKAPILDPELRLGCLISVFKADEKPEMDTSENYILTVYYTQKK